MYIYKHEEHNAESHLKNDNNTNTIPLTNHHQSKWCNIIT